MTENSDCKEKFSVDDSVQFCINSKKAGIFIEDKTKEYCNSCNDSSVNIISVENKNHEIDSKSDSYGCDDELHSLQDQCLKLSSLFKNVYHAVLDDENVPDFYESHANIVKELIANDPHQLFARLETDLQEFTIEIKLRQMEFLNCIHSVEGPQLFIFCLIEGYNKLMFAANTLLPLLFQLEIEHLATFNLSWRGLHQHLFYKIVFTEPKIQNVLPFCISKLGKISSELSDFNKILIRQFLTFDDEMTKIGEKWEEMESSFIKYHQENSILDAKQRMLKIDWELMKTQIKLFHEELKSSGISSEIESGCISEDEVKFRSHESIDNNCNVQSIKDTSYHIKTLTENFNKMKVELQNLHNQQLCDCCSVDTSVFINDSIPFSVKDTEAKSTYKEPCNNDHYDEYSTTECNEINYHSQEMALELFPCQQNDTLLVNDSLKEVSNHELNLLCADSVKHPKQQVDSTQLMHQSPTILTSEDHKTLVQKQVNTKYCVQTMQSPQQKIQKQWQDHQVLVHHQGKIDDRPGQLFPQRSIHIDKDMQKKMNFDKEIQKKVHLQMQQRFVQKHKQMEERYNQQKQQIEQHQEDSSLNKLELNENLSKSSSVSCNHANSQAAASQKSNHNCSVITTSVVTSTTATTSCSISNPSASSAVNTIVFTSKTITSTAGNNSTNVTLKNSTTQTTSASVNGQNRNHHHPLPDVVKSASYVCPKHSDTNKQNGLHNHRDESNSSESFSDDDYSSERSNSPQRHCDCGYCEVFGSAPVSRNFQETRERLRLILTKKKAKSNSGANSADTPIKNTSNNSNTATSTQLGTNQSTLKIKKDEISDKRMSSAAEYKGDKSIEEIMDFIEGNKSRNMKRIAKKLRRKQRQLEEEERKRKEKEEAERLRQEELKRQEEEERKRLEKERRKQELLEKNKKNKKKNSKQENQMKSFNNATNVTNFNKNKNTKNQVMNEKLKNSNYNNNQRIIQEHQSSSGGKSQKNNTTINNNLMSSNKQINQSIKNQAFHKQNSFQQQQSSSKLQNRQQKCSAISTNVQNKHKVTQQTKHNQQQKKINMNQQQRKLMTNNKEDGNEGQPQMVTIKRVMQPNSNEPTVTITLRGPTPKDDKVLYTLLNGQMCRIKNEKNKKQISVNSSNNNNTKNITKQNSIAANSNSNINSNNNNININNRVMTNNFNNSVMPNANSASSRNLVNVNSITERIERLKLGPQPVFTETIRKPSAPPLVSQAELTTPTAIQINQAVNQLSNRPTFPNNFDLENIKLPPGITITKVDPTTVQRKPVQIKQQLPPPNPLSSQIHNMRSPLISSAASSSNVILVDTGDKNNLYNSDDQNSQLGKKKRRRRNKRDVPVSGNGIATTNASLYGSSNGFAPRLDHHPMNAASMFGVGNSFIGADYSRNVQHQQQQQQPAAIIQMNGSMVTIRNPAVHPVLSRQNLDYQDGSKMRKNMVMDSRNANLDENQFLCAPEELENGDADEYERELEAFKRFCSQSVPAESKAKVNLNIEDIVLKKKVPVIGCS